MIQIEVSAINGLSVIAPTKLAEKAGWKDKDQGAEVDIDKAIIVRSHVSLANIFFKMQH
jgi:hypothetical protein